MVDVKIILLLIFSAASFAWAADNDAANLTRSFENQWDVLEALRIRYPYAQFELSVEIEPNTLPPAPSVPALTTTTSAIPISPSSIKIEKVTEAPKKPQTKPKKILSKPKNMTKKAKN